MPCLILEPVCKQVNSRNWEIVPEYEEGVAQSVTQGGVEGDLGSHPGPIADS